MVAPVISTEPLSTNYLPLSDGMLAEYARLGSGLPLIVLPGLAGGIDLLAPLLHTLAEEYEVIAIQYRGERHGLFDRNFHFRRLVQDVREVVLGLRLERPGMLGVSFGAAIALEYGANFPHSLEFLAVQGGAPHFRPRLFTQVLQELLERRPLPSDSPFLNQFFRILVGHRPRPEENFDFIVHQCWQTDQCVMAHRLRLLQEFDLEHQLHLIQAPTLVLAGLEDSIVPAPESRLLAQHVPNANFVSLPNAGHLAFATHPQAIMDRLACFQRHAV